MSELSEFLVRRRKELHLTQTEACKKIGIVRATLAYYESGQRVPTVAIARRIAEVYGIPVESILQGNEADQDDSVSPNMQILFNELSGASEEDIQKVIEIARVLRRSNGGSEW